VIVVLTNQLTQLLLCVVAEGRIIGNRVHERNFRPHHQPFLVAQVVEVLRVLIVRQPHRGGPDLADQRHVLVVLRFADGPTEVATILVPVDAMQIERVTVQRKAGVGVNRKGTEAERCSDGIDDLTVAAHLCDRRIQVRIGEAVPQMRTVDVAL